MHIKEYLKIKTKLENQKKKCRKREIYEYQNWKDVDLMNGNKYFTSWNVIYLDIPWVKIVNVFYVKKNDILNHIAQKKKINQLEVDGCNIEEKTLDVDEILNIDKLLDSDSICIITSSSESDTGSNSGLESNSEIELDLEIEVLETCASFFGKNYTDCNKNFELEYRDADT